MTARPDADALTSEYTVARPNVGHLSKITTAASLLAKESFGSDLEVYECKDEASIPYLGDSMGLAYLLALIHRSRITVWEHNEQSPDVWCTGSIDVVGDKPLLNNVYRNLFTVKLQAFLADEHDELFIVPVANIESSHRELCRANNVNLLSLESASAPLLEKPGDGGKSVLLVHGHELEGLVHRVFGPAHAVKNSVSRSSAPRPIQSAQAEFDVFLCYAPNDKAAILKLKQTLTDYGLNVWLDDEQIDIGDSVRDTIERGVGQSRFLVVCLSRHFSNSSWCRTDYESLLQRILTTRNADVLPVLTGDYDEADIPEIFYDKYCVDVRTADGLNRLIRKLKPAAVTTAVSESADTLLPQALHTGLHDLQEKLLRLTHKQTATDGVIIDFDAVGTELLGLLSAFPDYFDHFHEIITEYQHVAENLFYIITEDEYRRVLNVRVHEFEQAIEDVAGGFRYGESFLTKEPGADSPYGFYTTVFGKLETEQGIKTLLSGDKLEESEAIDWLLKSGFSEARSHLQRISDQKTLDAVFQVLWTRFPRIFLYYHQTFWDVVKYMLARNPLRWKLRFHALRLFLKRSLTAHQAAEILQNFIPSEQHILSAFLALHPKRECRAFALKHLPLKDRWDILLCPDVPWLIIQELVEKSCREASDSYIKALFLLLRPRLMSVNSPLTIAQAYHILTVFYHIPIFLQETFFQALIALHKHVGARAQEFPMTRELEERIQHVFQAFCSNNKLKDVDITEMRHIPLPIQRKLAYDGYLPKYFICNIRDIIALETVRHVEKRQDVIKFFRLHRINGRALEKLAGNKFLMKDYRLRSTFCHNPKANPILIRMYLSTLNRREIKGMAVDKNVSAYARELAAKHVSRYE